METEPEPRLENPEAPEELNIDLQIIPEHGLLSNGGTKFHRCTDGTDFPCSRLIFATLAALLNVMCRVSELGVCDVICYNTPLAFVQ